MIRSLLFSKETNPFHRKKLEKKENVNRLHCKEEVQNLILVRDILTYIMTVGDLEEF